MLMTLMIIRTTLNEKMFAIPSARQRIMHSTPVLDLASDRFIYMRKWFSGVIEGSRPPHEVANGIWSFDQNAKCSLMTLFRLVRTRSVKRQRGRLTIVHRCLRRPARLAGWDMVLQNVGTYWNFAIWTPQLASWWASEKNLGNKSWRSQMGVFADDQRCQRVRQSVHAADPGRSKQTKRAGTIDNFHKVKERSGDYDIHLCSVVNVSKAFDRIIPRSFSTPSQIPPPTNHQADANGQDPI